MLLKKLRIIMNEADEAATPPTDNASLPSVDTTKPKKLTRQEEFQRKTSDGIANEESNIAKKVSSFLSTNLPSLYGNIINVVSDKSVVYIRNASELLSTDDTFSNALLSLINTAIGATLLKTIETPSIIPAAKDVMIVITLKSPTL